MSRLVLFNLLIVSLFVGISLSSSLAFAQDGGGSGGQHQAGVFLGNMLPNNVPGLDEITPLWGFRYSYPLASMAYAEGGGVFSHSNGVDWKGAFVSARMDIPLETLTAMAYIGLDYTNYSGVGQKTTNKGGGHAGGGVMSLIGGSTYMRFDMKLLSQPGTILYFSLGLTQGF